MFRTTLCCAGLVMGVLIGLSEAAPAACEGDGCGSKPLNIMQFMREQAASTRGPRAIGQQARPPSRAEPYPSAAAAPQAPHRAIAARKRSVPAGGSRHILRIAAGADTPPPAMRPPTIPSTAPPMRLRRNDGRGRISGPEVQLVDAEDINDIDRKADSAPPCRAIRCRLTVVRRTASKPAFPGCGGSGLRLGARSRRWQRRCTNSSV